MNTTRYNRQIILPEVGVIGQQKLQRAKVLIIGAGGLGVAVLPYLTAAGIGEIGIMDDDKIDVTNLHRQVIYKSSSVGKSKVLEATAMALELNPSIKINAITERLNHKNAISLFEQYDIIVDATDNLNTKYLINDACCVTNKPFVYGSIYKFEGQVSVFNYEGGPTYRCLFPDETSDFRGCNEAGVLGISVGIIGMFQANEVLKIILGIGEVMYGKLLVYNILNNEQQKFEFSKSTTVTMDKLSFEKKYVLSENPIFEIAAIVALKQINNPKVVFLDVRNSDEYPKMAIHSCVQIPLDELEKEWHRLDSTATLYVFCQSGIRSKKAVEILMKHNFENVKSIAGGAKKMDKIGYNKTASVSNSINN
ncbi:HesA/MoeB/ThiF family protein [Flavobacterium psychrotolerans]|uniref:Molybdopterin-synthase adenylyltransferase n=1 Tax=Flavobacterium psychrotolerans TaxID=2169410 RepID=A0A2U1JHM6_9FLAO|nr:HesA/MoeB/ThiF family protein [Flavobacterium psychrotolerans]PWA04621.1 thiamine biosynthesis protein ThiF [Flavobacterium psychrotolerans]